MSAAQLSSLTSKAKIGLATGLLASFGVVPGYQVAGAYPEGAPWGAADPNDVGSCATCHFDKDTVHGSSSLTIAGLTEKLTPNTSYDLVVTFVNPGGVAAGFQMIAWAENQDAGFFSSECEDTETVGSKIRSTAPTIKEGPVSWAVQWRTPPTKNTTIRIYLAAIAANHDQSPLGDRVHFRSYNIVVE